MILFDSSELQQKIIDCVTSDGIDKFFDATYFKDNPESKACRQAMIHGMVIAGMMTCQCNTIHITEKKIKTNADKIRAMSDDELASLMDNSLDYFNCEQCEFREVKPGHCSSKHCKDYILKWLKSEVKD